MIRYNRIISLLLALIIGLTVEMLGAAVRLRVDMPRGRRSISMGDQFYITMEISDMDNTPERPSDIPGAKLLYFERTGQSSRFSSYNGKTTQSYSYTYTMTLRANKEGSFTYGPVTVGGVKSNAVTYSIGKAESDPTPGANEPDRSGQQRSGQADDSTKPKYIGKGDGNLYLRANVSKSTAYEQEALVYTVKLYTTYDAVKFIGATAAPKFDGFVVEESKDISTQLSYETVNGKTYATAIIARYIIFPQMAGSLKVSGNTYTISVDEREYYHDPFWGNLSYSKPLQLNVTPNDLVIKVNNLPSPKPADFSGGVGTFTITSSLESNQFFTNQAAAIVYNVTGTGNIKYVTMPDLNVLYPPQLEVYSPTTETKVNVGSQNVSGTMKMDYSFMPLEEGEFVIPEVKLVYFNPATGKYETSVAKGYNITVKPGKNSSKSQTRNRLKFDDNLKTVGNDLSKDHKPMVDSFLYWLWYIIPVILFIAYAVYRAMYNRSHADMAAFNSRRADKLARRRLKKAYNCMKKGDREAFYDEMLSALWGYLGDKLKMPMSELMRENIVQVMTEHNVPQEKIDSMVNLLDECDFAKYAPSVAGLEMKSIYEKAISIINQLEESFKRPQPKSKDNMSDKLPLIILIMTFICGALGNNAMAADNIANAASAYEAGDYSKAVELYKTEIEKKGTSSELLYNIGNAYVKAGDYGNAVVNYERALRLDPGNDEIKNNLNYVNSKVADSNVADAKGKKVSVLPDQLSFFGRAKHALLHEHSSDTYAVWGVVFFLLLIACCAVYLYMSAVLARKIGFFGGIVCLCLTVVMVILAVSSANAFNSHDEAVIKSYRVALLEEPDSGSKANTLPLNRGTKLMVLQEVKEDNVTWIKVKLNSDYIGWVRAEEIEKI